MIPRVGKKYSKALRLASNRRFKSREKTITDSKRLKRVVYRFQTSNKLAERRASEERIKNNRHTIIIIWECSI
jgi:hypothetical protein